MGDSQPEDNQGIEDNRTINRSIAAPSYYLPPTSLEMSPNFNTERGNKNIAVTETHVPHAHCNTIENSTPQYPLTYPLQILTKNADIPITSVIIINHRGAIRR